MVKEPRARDSYAARTASRSDVSDTSVMTDEVMSMYSCN